MFEYDPAKSAANKAKHGIDFEEAQALWLDERRYEIPTRNMGSEERWLVVGQIDERMWAAVITYRNHAMRLISVRRARIDEEKWYGQQGD